MAVVLLSAVLAGAGCGRSPGSIVVDAGLTTTIDACSPESSTYVGFLELSKTSQFAPSPGPHVVSVYGTNARFFQKGPPYPSAPLNITPALFCGGAGQVGQCCISPLPIDADAGTAAMRVGPEHVTCLDAQIGNTNGSVGMLDPYGGVTTSAWSGGDSLDCSADGGVAGSFTTSTATPPDFAGLGHDLFPLDGGAVTISRTQDLEVTWTAGAASSTVAINLVGSKSGIACLAADTGSFSVPSILLNQLPPQDQGFIAVYRYVATCAQTPTVQVSVLVENGVAQRAVYP